MRMLSVFLLFLGGFAAQGQEPEGPPARDAVRLLAGFFELTEDQITQLGDFLTTREQNLQPLMEELRILRGEFRDLVNADPADPTAIGNNVLAEKAANQDMRAVNEAFGDQFMGMLTDEQLDRYFALGRAARVQPVVEAARAIRLPLFPPEDEGPEF